MARKLKIKDLATRQAELDLAAATPRVTAGIPCCEAPYCLADGRFVMRKPGWEGLRGPRRYVCAVHEAWAVQSLASASV